MWEWVAFVLGYLALSLAGLPFWAALACVIEGRDPAEAWRQTWRAFRRWR